MKKILFVMDSLRVGGIQTAFINMLKVIDYKKYDVTVQLFHYNCNDREKIPSNVKILRMPFVIDAINCTRQEAKLKGGISYCVKICGTILCKLLGANVIYRNLFKFKKNDDIQYDVAVSFNNNLSVRTTYFGCNMYVLDFVKAKYKISWLHVDYKAMNMNTPVNNEEYSRFDRIVHVSNACKEAFLEFNPELVSKSVVAYNVIDDRELNERKKECISIGKREKSISIVTVARLDPNKNIIACIRVAKRLLDAKIDFNWFVVGDGQERELLVNSVLQFGLSENFHFLGYKNNPYPYIFNSDILVSTSLSESFGMVIYESLVLGVPVIAKDYPALREIVDNKSNGFICSNEDEIFNVLKRMCTDKDYYNKVKQNSKPLLDFGSIVEMNNNVLNF